MTVHACMVEDLSPVPGQNTYQCQACFAQYIAPICTHRLARMMTRQGFQCLYCAQIFRRDTPAQDIQQALDAAREQLPASQKE